MVDKRFRRHPLFLPAAILGGVILGVFGLLGGQFAKRWVRREIARAFKELQPFQPTTFIVSSDEGDSDDDAEG